MTRDDKEKRAEAWRKWYAENRQKLLKVYRKRFRTKVANETKEERELRLAKQRKAQRAYAKRKKAKNVRSR